MLFLFTSYLNVVKTKLETSKRRLPLKDEVEELTPTLFIYLYGRKLNPNALHIW